MTLNYLRNKLMPNFNVDRFISWCCNWDCLIYESKQIPSDNKSTIERRFLNKQ